MLQIWHPWGSDSLELRIEAWKAGSLILLGSSCRILSSTRQLWTIGAIFFFFFCLFAISWAAPAAYGGSQARG